MTEQRIAELEAMHERGTIRRGHIDEMLVELRRLHEEVTEQARLLGISAERELSLLAKIDRLEKQLGEAVWNYGEKVRAKATGENQ